MERLIAIGILVGLFAKSIYEAAVGHVFFESTHLGYVGIPVVVSHLAGVIGAVVIYTLLNVSQCLSYWKVMRKEMAFNI